MASAPPRRIAAPVQPLLLGAPRIEAGRPERARDEDEELDEELDLPIGEDDGADDDEGQVDDHDTLIDPLRDDGGDPLDDANANDLDTGVDVDALDREEGDLDEGEVDVGALDEGIDADEDAGADDGEKALDEEDRDLDYDERTSDDDGGAEGTEDPPEGEVDEAALPELDEDDAEENDTLGEELLAEAEEALPPWAAARWGALEGAGAAVPCQAIAIAGGRVAAAGEVLLIVDEGARAARKATFGERASSVALTEELVACGTPRGQLVVGRADDATTLVARSAGHGPLDLAATPGRLWVRCGGALLGLSAIDQPLATARERGVIAIAASGGALIALAADAGPELARLRGDDEGWQSTALHGDARRLVEGKAPGAVRLAAAAGGRLLAISDGARMAISRDGGGSFAIHEIGQALALAFAGDEAQAPLLALIATRRGGAIVQVGAGGAATRLAELGGITAEAPAAIAWDPSREVAWVACATGLFAFGRAQKH